MSNEQHSKQAPAASRAPYIKPEFEYQQVFETTALTCGKISSTMQQCKTYRKLS